jgi:hypothetical protein
MTIRAHTYPFNDVDPHTVTEKTDVTYSFSDMNEDVVNAPSHYRQHPSGVECIDITKHMSFCLGNAVKYIWRAGLKTEDPTEDLQKAIKYLTWEIERLGGK